MGEEIAKELLDILACPSCKASLKYIKNELICAKCKSRYPVKEGIPVLMVK